MAVNKVDINGETLIDLTQDTVTSDNMLKGVTAHAANGEVITGDLTLYMQHDDVLDSGHTSTSTASGLMSDATGGGTSAIGNYSHAEGEGTIARADHSHVQGRFNIDDTNRQYLHIVGNGYSYVNKDGSVGYFRSNAHTVDASGNAWYQGRVSVGNPINPPEPVNENDLTTKKYTDTKLNEKSDTGHTHDTDYASATHNHDEDYSAISHNHDTVYSKTNHTHNYAGSSSAGGAATSAVKLSTSRNISLTGAVIGTGTFDGSGDLSIETTSNITVDDINVSANNLGAGYTKNEIYLNTHPENYFTLIPFINNDIAYLTKKGGSVKVTYNGTEKTIADILNIFDGSPSYCYFDLSGATNVQIELTLHKKFGYNNTFYIDFGAALFRAKDITTEVMNTNISGDTWTEVSSKTSLDTAQYRKRFSYTPTGGTSSDGFNKIRFTFSNFNNASQMRIAQLGIISYNSYGLRETFIPKDGGNVYGNIYPNTNNTLSLGTSSYKYKDVYATTLHGSLDGNASTSTKATQDSAGLNINQTYIKDLSFTGNTLTYTKGNGTTGTTSVSVDLTNYYTKTETENYINEVLGVIENGSY